LIGAARSRASALLVFAGQKKTGPGNVPEPVFITAASLIRALAPVAAAEAEAAERDRCPSPG
jgi:hypothetical protein